MVGCGDGGVVANCGGARLALAPEGSPKKGDGWTRTDYSLTGGGGCVGDCWGWCSPPPDFIITVGVILVEVGRYGSLW